MSQKVNRLTPHLRRSPPPSGGRENSRTVLIKVGGGGCYLAEHLRKGELAHLWPRVWNTSSFYRCCRLIQPQTASEGKGCTLCNPASRLTTGHRSAQRPSGGPKGGRSRGEWMREKVGGTPEPPPRTPPIKGRFHAVRQAERPERGKAENGSLGIVGVCLTLSVGE